MPVVTNPNDPSQVITDSRDITDFSSPEVQQAIADHIAQAAAQGIVVPPEAFSRPGAPQGALPPPRPISSASAFPGAGLAAATRNALQVNLGALSQKLGPFGPLIAVTAGILGTFGALSAMHRLKPAPVSSDRSRSRRGRRR